MRPAVGFLVGVDAVEFIQCIDTVGCRSVVVGVAKP